MKSVAIRIVDIDKSTSSNQLTERHIMQTKTNPRFYVWLTAGRIESCCLTPGQQPDGAVDATDLSDNEYLMLLISLYPRA